jgi:uncharacterized membrane protein
MLIQFHLAAFGHIALWLLAFYDLHQSHAPGWEEGAVLAAMVYAGLPLSFGVLIIIYILFRLLLAYTDFSTALKTMITVDIVHAVVMSIVIITPLRLAIPIVLYSIACYCYYRTTGNESRERSVAERTDQPAE